MQVERRSFNLNKNIKTTDVQKETLIYKGDSNTINISFNDIEKLVISLHQVKDVKIRELNSQHKENYNKIVRISMGLYRNKQYYKKLYDICQKYFGNEPDIKPMTVAAFFTGCSNNSTKHMNKKSKDISRYCSATCAGSMRKPEEEDDKDDSFCSFNIIYCIRNDVTFEFEVLNKVPDTDNALLYLNYTNINDFPGFSSYEKSYLIETLGVRNVKLVSYSSTNEVPKNLMGNKSITVEDIKLRKPLGGKLTTEQAKVIDGKSQLQKAENESKCTLTFIFALLMTFLFVMLILFFVIWITSPKKCKF